MSGRSNFRPVAAASAVLIVGAICLRVVEPGVRVEKPALSGNTLATRISPATPGDGPPAAPADVSTQPPRAIRREVGVPSFLEITGRGTLAHGVLYFSLAGLAWLLGYGLFKRRWVHRKIVVRFPESADVRREIGYSCCSLVIFSLVAAATVWAPSGWTRVYWRVADRGWTWLWASVIVTIFIHDAYFYWTHRLMHHPRLFPIFHRTHHLSHNPSPWAAYAFDPAEAVVQAGIFPLTALLIPIHPLAFNLFMLCQITHNIVAHTGYEFHPRWLMQTPLKFFLTPTHHAMHHEKLRGNYGIYFNFWDRLMGTNRPHYEPRFAEVTTRDRESLPRP